MVFIKNAIIADAIGSVELKDLPPDIDQVVSMAVDKWDSADDTALDAMVALILFMVSLTASVEGVERKLEQPPSQTWPPRDNFPRYN
jgi:hypothetical protein